MKLRVVALFVIAAQVAYAQAPRPVPASAGQFAALRWLEGSWKGTGAGLVFYERYTFTNDSTIATQGFGKDSAFKAAEENGTMQLRNREIRSGDNASGYLATAIGPDSIVFVSVRNPNNGFVWRRRSPTEWIATIRSRNAQGVTREIVYTMQRVKR